MNNTAIWDALGKTDPSQTKGFKRGGGFTGTSVKPMWVYRRLTEHFGPAGIGWGVNEPKFDIVHSQEGEVLVYCTVSAWHGSKDNILWGVGGDKAVTKNRNGVYHDDEAFKKATTDAVMNAFKTIGTAADIHMGLFDDDKYVEAAKLEFAEPPAVITENQVTELQTYFAASTLPVAAVLKKASDNTGLTINDLRDLPATEFEAVKSAALSRPKQKETV